MCRGLVARMDLACGKNSKKQVSPGEGGEK